MSVELLSGQQHGACRAVARGQGKALHRPVIHHQPKFGRGDTETGSRLRHPQVTGDGQLRSCAQRRALDGGNRRNGHRGE